MLLFFLLGLVDRVLAGDITAVAAEQAVTVRGMQVLLDLGRRHPHTLEAGAPESGRCRGCGGYRVKRVDSLEGQGGGRTLAIPVATAVLVVVLELVLVAVGLRLGPRAHDRCPGSS